MNILLALAWTLIYYVILYPLVLVLQLLGNIVLSLVRAAEFILLPFAYLGRFVLDALLFPFVFVSRFEVRQSLHISPSSIAQNTTDRRLNELLSRHAQRRDF